MLNDIEEKLKEFQKEADYEDVLYGLMEKIPENWNYIVFSRDRMKRSENSNNDFDRRYRVVLVHEDYIPDGEELRLIRKMKEIKGLKLSKEDIVYDYAVNPKTKGVVEMAVLTFAETLKGYEVRGHGSI